MPCTESNSSCGQAKVELELLSVPPLYLILVLKTKPGGEGITFILPADSGLPENSQGRWLGTVNATTNGAYQEDSYSRI